MRPCNIVFIARKQSLLCAAVNVISVCHKTKRGIDEDIPQYRLAFNYFADKNSTENKRESKMKKANRNNHATYLPWRKLAPVYPYCVSLLCLTRRYFWPRDICERRKWSHRIHLLFIHLHLVAKLANSKTAWREYFNFISNLNLILWYSQTSSSRLCN